MASGYGFRFKGLDVYRLAVEHFEWTCEVVGRMPKGPFKVTDQAVGAAMSIMGNIGEASGRDERAGEAQQHYRYALGSTFEAATHIDAFAALRVIDAAEHEAAEARLSRIAPMLRSLITRQRNKARSAPRSGAKKKSAPPRRSGTPPEERSPQASTPRASGVAASPKGAAAIDPARSAVPQGAKRPSGIDPRAAGPRGSEATERDRPSHTPPTAP